MAKIEISIEHPFIIGADRDDAWAFLIDTRRAVSHYPAIEQLVELGDNKWRWELEKIGAKGFSHQVVYAVEYHFDEEAGRIIWEPISGEGNSVIRGEFQLSDHRDGTEVILQTSGLLEVPVPRLFKSMAKPFVKDEFNSQIKKYASNLKVALEK